MDFNTLSPYIRTALDSRVDASWKLKERVIFDYEILYVKAGKVFITVEKEEFYGSSGDIFFFKPNQPHSIKVLDNTPFWQPHIHFDLFYQENSPLVNVSFRNLAQMYEADMLLFREDITSGPELYIPNKITVSNAAYFESLLMNIIREHSHPDAIRKLAARGTFLELFSYLLHELAWRSSQSKSIGIDLMEKVRNHIHQNWDQAIRLDDLSNRFNVNKYHLCRAYCKAYGTSPIKYQKMLQTKNAQELIRFTTLSLTQIASQTGADSIQAFSRMFKRATGMSPSQYRKVNQDR